jgi:hypothetical protein
MDHLIYILTRKAIPYFVAKHQRQSLGFEGLDLELKRWRDVEIGAREIAKSDIQEIHENSEYRVRSQTDSDTWYTVDLATASSCDCPSYPLISFCKHISAVQIHFMPSCTVIPFPSTPMDIQHTDAMETTLPTPKVPGAVPPTVNETSSLFTRIGQKMLDLASHAAQSQDMQLAPTLLGLEAQLDGMREPLPRRIPIAPNQHSWSETAMVMGVKPKTKRKLHTDPYSGGEKSGKKAKPDARSAKPSPSRYGRILIIRD